MHHLSTRLLEKCIFFQKKKKSTKFGIQCHAKTAEAFIEAGASVLVKSVKGKNALDVLSHCKHPRMKALVPVLEKLAREELAARIASLRFFFVSSTAFCFLKKKSQKFWDLYI